MCTVIQEYASLKKKKEKKLVKLVRIGLNLYYIEIVIRNKNLMTSVGDFDIESAVFYDVNG